MSEMDFRDGDPDTAPTKKAPVMRTDSRAFDDPVVRALAWLGAIVGVLFLAAVVSALVLGVLDPPAPRTAVERDLSLAESQIDAGSVDPQIWYNYVSALIATNQYARAERMIGRARDAKIDNPAKQYMLVALTRLDLARGNYEKAIADSDDAIVALQKQLEYEQEQFQATKTPTTMIAEGLGPNYEVLQLLRAEAFVGLDKTAEAIASLDTYLELNARAADILVWRGDLKAESGDNDGAIADYKAASQYLPGDTELQDKLTKLGASDE
jgi:tetratricopeptide (TPR) repeat protein